ncbi:alpha/beta hydrolase [Nocardia sp. NPDC005366]|uniref:alpha/beta fold hydrolase n=1 Tax=Nocardia sp. NPDC005366 TaxID=3156878 RepID=UPI0033B7E72B
MNQQAVERNDGGIPPIGDRYRVAGRRLFLHRSGEGGPAVVFLPGANSVGLDYLKIHEAVAAFTTSVLYDRGGTGWSDRIELPRTASEVAAELRSLLSTAGIDGPYILVAHSLGGAYARRFAQMFPGDVAGLVALESFSEDWDAYMPEDLYLDQTPDAVPGRFQTTLLRVLSRPFYRKMFSAWPAEIRTPLVAGHVDRDWMVIGAKERSNMTALREELKAGPAFPDVPLIAIAALGSDSGQRLSLSKKMLGQLNDSKARLYAAMAESVTNGEYRPLPTARHSTIQLDEPDAIIEAIRDVHTRAAAPPAE